MKTLHIFDMDGTLVDNDCDVSWKVFLVDIGVAPRGDLELAQKYYDDIYEQMAKRAAHGVTQLRDEKKSLAFFQLSFRGMPIPPGVTDIEQHLKDLYEGQEECYKMLEATGFKVTKEEPRFPSLLDPKLTEQQRQLIQNEQMSIEAIVTISLE